MLGADGPLYNAVNCRRLEKRASVPRWKFLCQNVLKVAAIGSPPQQEEGWLHDSRKVAKPH